MEKKQYVKMVMTPAGFELQKPLLVAGSITSIPVKINKVEVEDFKQGFDIDGNDFKNLDFD